MKKLLPAATILSLGLSIPLLKAQSQPAQRPKSVSTPKTQPATTRTATTRTVRGEAFFLERIALAPRAMLHVSLVGRVAGAEDLPLAATIVPAKNGVTPFKLSVPTSGVPAGPYRLQAWIVGDNRVMLAGRDAQTTLDSLGNFAKIRLQIMAAPQNIDGIGDGQPLPAQTQLVAPQDATQAAPAIPAAPILAAPQARKLRGTVSKLDRRAISPDARLSVQLRDVSLADAPSPLILGQDIQLDGKQLPKTFEISLLPSDLAPGRRYALSAQVFEKGKLTYTTDTNIPVTPENVGTPFELRVVAAR